MKAIMINSKEETVHVIELSSNQDTRRAEIYDRLECRTYEIAKYFDNGDVLLVDEEGLLTMTSGTKAFQIRDLDILVGNGLIIGPEIEFDDGSWTLANVKTSLDSMIVNFLQCRLNS